MQRSILLCVLLIALLCLPGVSSQRCILPDATITTHDIAIRNIIIDTPATRVGQTLDVSYRLTALAPVNIESQHIDLLISSGRRTTIERSINQPAISLERGQSITITEHILLDMQGKWKITLGATTERGKTAAGSCTFSVINTNIPINLTLDKQPVLGETVTLTADIGNRSLSWLQLYVNDVRIKECKTSPCSGTYRIPAQGTYDLYAILLINDSTYHAENITFTITTQPPAQQPVPVQVAPMSTQTPADHVPQPELQQDEQVQDRHNSPSPILPQTTSEQIQPIEPIAGIEATNQYNELSDISLNQYLLFFSSLLVMLGAGFVCIYTLMRKR